MDGVSLPPANTFTLVSAVTSLIAAVGVLWATLNKKDQDFKEYRDNKGRESKELTLMLMDVIKGNTASNEKLIAKLDEMDKRSTESDLRTEKSFEKTVSALEGITKLVYSVANGTK